MEAAHLKKTKAGIKIFWSHACGCWSQWQNPLAFRSRTFRDCLQVPRATSRFWRLTLGRSLVLYSHMCSMKQFWKQKVHIHSEKNSVSATCLSYHLDRPFFLRLKKRMLVLSVLLMCFKSLIHLKIFSLALLNYPVWGRRYPAML